MGIFNKLKKEHDERLENIRRLDTTVRAAKSRQIQKILDKSQEEQNDMTQAFSFGQANVSDQFMEARSLAGCKIQDTFAAYSKPDSHQHCDYCWIRNEITYPSFDHLVFRFKNMVYSVYIDFIDRSHGYGLTVKKEYLEQIRICENNNMIPCLYLLDPKTMTPPSRGLNLINTATREPVDPMEISTDEPVEMSDWEMHNFAIQVAIQDLINKGFEIGSFCDYPGIAPNIWFSRKEPVTPSWAFVRFHKGQPAPSNQIRIPDCHERLKQFPGYYASVTFNPLNGATKFIRGDLIDVTEVDFYKISKMGIE